MTAPRSRKEEEKYKRHRRKLAPDQCQFCEITDKSSQFVTKTKHFKVIKNIFGYSLWDGQKVIDHLLIIPKKHTDNLSNMGSAQKVEYVNLLQRYEKKGYSVYARAPVSVMKSVPHQHTHLIKTTGKPVNFILNLRKPIIRIVR